MKKEIFIKIAAIFLAPIAIFFIFADILFFINLIKYGLK